MGVGTLGRVSRNLSIEEKMIIHNCITVVRENPNQISSEYLYYSIKKYQKYFENSAHGSTGQTSLNIDIVKNLEIIIPEKSIHQHFTNLIRPMWKKIGILKKKNKMLKHMKSKMVKNFFNKN